MRVVKVWRFKESGKFYDEIELKVYDDNWYLISEQVRKERAVRGTDMEWLIGMEDVVGDEYPMLLKGHYNEN